MVSRLPLTRKKLTRLLMLPEVSQVTEIAKKVDNAEAVTAKVEIVEVETKESAMRPEVAIVEIVESVQTVVNAEAESAEVVTVEVVNAEVAKPEMVKTEEVSTEEVSAEEVNAEVETVVSVDLKVKVVKLKSTVEEIVPELPDLPDKKVVTILEMMIMEKEEVALAATEVDSEVPVVVELILLLLTQAELILDLLATVSPEVEVDSEEASEEAVVVSEVKEERVVSTDQKVTSLDTTTDSTLEAEVVREELELPVVATALLVAVMPLTLQHDDRRELF